MIKVSHRLKVEEAGKYVIAADNGILFIQLILFVQYDADNLLAINTEI